LSIALGSLYGVGVGPGDPELLTLKARRIISEAPVVAVPKSQSSEASYALTIVDGFIDRDRQEVLELSFPMREGRAQIEHARRGAAEAILEQLKQGKDVAFITEGDPFLYSTFIYAFQAIREMCPEVNIEVVPGVSSVNAAAVSALVPLANGEDRLAVLPATCPQEHLRAALSLFDTVVILKMSAAPEGLFDLLGEMELTSNSVLIKRSSTCQEEVVRDIGQLRGKKLDYFSLLIVRK